LTGDDSFPRWAWNASLIMLGGALLIALVLLFATLRGIADPPHFGEPTINQLFSGDDKGRIIAYEGDAQTVKTLAGEITCPCTVELRVVQTSGPTDAAYGLWWGLPIESPETLFGSTSDGYLAILPGDPATAAPVRDWQLFPHVRPLGEGNTFRIDVNEGQITVRLNDEVVSGFEISSRQISVGYFVQGSRAGDAAFQLISFNTWETNRMGD
jgi:hypothetical protein